MQKSLKIIHITSDYPPRALWGMGVYVETLQRGLSEKYKNIHSCVATASKSIAEDGACITTTKEEDALFLSGDNKTAIFNDFSKFLLWQEKLADAILDYFKTNSHISTVLHVNNWMSWLTAKKIRNIMDLPIVSSIHFLQKQYEVMVENPIPTYHNDIIEIELEMLSESDGVICFSNESERMVKGMYGIEREDIVTIPHASKICTDGTVVLNKTQNILFLGRLTHDKGILEVIRAVEYIREKYPDVHLHIIGDGELYSKISESTLPFVTLYGYIDDAQKIKRVAEGCSFSLLFSTSDVFPISVIDSMACGCIPFLPDRETVSIMFEDRVSGFRIGGDIAKNTADIIIDLLNNTDRLLDMRKNAQRYYNTHYSIDTLLKSTLAVYKKALLDKNKV